MLTQRCHDQFGVVSDMPEDMTQPLTGGFQGVARVIDQEVGAGAGLETLAGHLQATRGRSQVVRALSELARL